MTIIEIDERTYGPTRTHALKHGRTYKQALNHYGHALAHWNTHRHEGAEKSMNGYGRS